MNFRCLYCGRGFEVYSLKRIKVFCSHECHNTVVRQKLISPEEIAAERERRNEAYIERRKLEPKGVTMKCIICGKEMIQASSNPKLFCSPACCDIQHKQKIYSSEDIRLEKQRRRKAFNDALTPEHRKILEYGKQKRFEFCDREAERLGEDADGLQPTRHCHNYFTKVRCPNLTWDYYCPECRKKKRQGYVEESYQETESIWDDFSVPPTEEM